MPKDRCPICGGWHEPDLHERANPFHIVGAERIGYSVTPREPRGEGTRGSARAFEVEAVRNPDAERRAGLAAAGRRRRARRRVTGMVAVGLGAAAGLAGVWFGRGPFEEWRARRSAEEGSAFARPEASVPPAPAPRTPGASEPTESAPRGAGDRAASVVRDDTSDTGERPRVEIEIFHAPPESTASCRAGGRP